MTNCARCGKQLSNPKSIERGYGPVCYKKKLHEEALEQIELETGPTENNNYPSFTEYFQQILAIERNKDLEICSLHKTKLYDADFNHYLHKYDGWWLKGWKYRQWLYLECPKCGIARAFHHLRINRPFGNKAVPVEVQVHAQKTIETIQKENRKLDAQKRSKKASQKEEQHDLKSFIEA